MISMSITELMDRIISKRDTSAFIKLVEKAVEKTNILFMRKLSLQAVWYEVEDSDTHTLYRFHAIYDYYYLILEVEYNKLQLEYVIKRIQLKPYMSICNTICNNQQLAW